MVLRLKAGLPSLRRKESFKILKEAVKKARKKGLAVIHFSILGNHVHFVVESEKPLGKVIQTLTVSFAKRLNHLLNRKGTVFRDRYYARIIRGVREARNVLRYVLENHARHKGVQEILVDPFSSIWAISLDDLTRLLGRGRLETTLWSEADIEVWLSEVLVPPRTWLLRTGWKAA